MTSLKSMPLTLETDDDRTSFVEFFTQQICENETRTNSKIFRLDVPLASAHDTLFAPPASLLHYGPILTFMLNNEVSTCFSRYDSGTTEYDVLASFLKIPQPKRISTLKPGRIEEVLLILSCLYLLTRLSIPKDRTNVTTRRLLPELMNISKPDEHPITLALTEHYSQLRRLNTKKGSLSWTEPAKKFISDVSSKL